MDIRFGLENEDYKYVYGVFNKCTVPFDENKEISIVCGKNDRAAAQLLVYSEKEMLVCVNDDTCFHERGAIDVVRVSVSIPGLEGGSIKANLIGLVEDDDRQLKSDIILSQPFIHVERRKVQSVWIEAEIGENVVSGVYTPQITVYGHNMFEDEKALGTLTFTIKVMDVTMSHPEDNSFYLDLWQHNSNIARKYDLELWSDKHFEIMEGYVASLGKLGQKSISVIVSEIPWSGQNSCLDKIDPSNLFEYNMVKVKLCRDGNWSYDYSALNRYIELCMKYGVKDEIEVFGLVNIWRIEDAGFGGIIEDYDDAIRIRYLDETSQTYKYIKQKKDLVSYVSMLEKNFISKGWIGKVRILADEPKDPSIFVNRVNELKRMAPSFKYKVATNHASFIEQNMEDISDYTSILPCIVSEYEKICKLKKDIRGKMTYYVCCWPELPNTFISSHLLESRVIPWLAWYLGMDGFLRWNYTVWPNNPLNKISYHYPTFKAGDTNFVYPGRDGKPMLTLRYKLLQKGIRDFEIISRYVQDGGDREKLIKKMKKVFLWESMMELHNESRRKAEEVFSLDYMNYEEIIAEILTEMAAKSS